MLVLRRLLWSCLWLVLISGSARQLVAQTPIGPEWWPSEWGPEDQRGATNRITPENVVQAARLITKGEVYQLGRVYEHGMPLGANRFFSLTIPGLPTSGPHGDNKMVSNDELFSGQIGQVGTQLDGLAHVGVRVGDEDIFYNGFKLSEFGSAQGLRKLGVENMGPVFTRGVLLDVAGTKRVRRLEPGYVITQDDLEKALQATGLKIFSGDVVLIYTGHGFLWMKDNEAYGEAEPGIGMEAARWLTDKKICLIGSDNWGIEAIPGEDENLAAPVHHWTLVRHGIYHLENLDLERLAADKIYEFAFVFTPLRLKGATGSPGNPIAVR